MRFFAKSGAEYTFTKISSVSTSCDDFENADNIYKLNYEEEKEKHISAWADIWDKSYVEIVGDDEAEFALNYFKIKAPVFTDDVRVRVKDTEIDKICHVYTGKTLCHDRFNAQIQRHERRVFTRRSLTVVRAA